MSLTVPTDPGGPLVSLYRGALIGQALSKNLGAAQQTGGDISTALHATLLQAGVASGKINVSKLSQPDRNLLATTISTSGLSQVPTVKPQAAGGILGFLGTGLHAVENTGTDFLHAMLGVPAGLAALGKAAYKTAQETTPFAHSEVGGPDLLGLGGQIAKSTISDFTHFDPMHPLYPMLDIAGAVSGGLGLAARSGSALARLSAAGDIARAGGEVGRVSGTLGRLPGMSRLGGIGQGVATKLAGSVRPEVPISESAQQATNLSSPSIPISNYSVSPFRRLLLEKPVERITASRVGQADIPFLRGNKSLSDLRANYHIRKYANTMRGRMSGASVSRSAEMSTPLVESLKNLQKNSLNDQEAMLKFNAMALLRQLAAENLNPAERLDRLDAYRESVLATGSPRVEGVPQETKQAEQIRSFYREQTRAPKFREFFSNPTEDMWNVRNAWDETLMQRARELNLDPHEVLNRSLGPAAHVLGKTPEEMLREQPLHIQNSMNFAMKAREVEDAVRQEVLSNADEGSAPERALAPVLARYLPGEDVPIVEPVRVAPREEALSPEALAAQTRLARAQATLRELFRYDRPEKATQAEVDAAERELEDAKRAVADAKLKSAKPAPVEAPQLPGSWKLGLVKRAIDSVHADASGMSPRELLNNAGSTGYLPGANLAQKVAQALMDHGVPETVAEPFATGGLTNYFPMTSAVHSQRLRYNSGPIGRATNRLVRTPLSKLTRGIVKEKDVAKGLHEFKHENVARIANSANLGVEPFASFLREADLSSFKAGLDRRDPMPLIRHISAREKMLVHRQMGDPMIERLALKDADGKVATFPGQTDLQNKLGDMDEAAKWRLLPVNAVRSLIHSEDQAALDVANALKEEGEMTPELAAHVDRIADESAMSYVRDLSAEAGEKGDNLIALPTSYVENLIKHARIMDSGNRVGSLWQGFINRWRHAVLAYMPSWLLRTSMGHGVILFIQGAWNPVHYIKAMQFYGNGFHVPLTDEHLLGGELKREVPAGIDQGAPHSEFGQKGFRTAIQNPIPTAITHSVHRVANFQRRAAFLSNLDRVTRQHFAELRQTFDLPGGLRNVQNYDRIVNEHPELVHQALNELDKASYTFGQMTPWERRLAKNVLPFWGWYKFMSKFVWNLPITYPGRALAIARLGQVGESEIGQLGPMPDWLRSSLMFDTHNLADVHYYSMMGLNPLGDAMNPFEGFQGIVRLGQMSPIFQSILEGAGYNTMTGGLENIDPSSGIVEINGRYVNIHTGKEYDSIGQASLGADLERFFGGLARSFPEIRLAEIGATRGKSVYPESLPFIYERPIPPSSPASIKDASPLGLLAQYAGVGQKTYNLQKYQANLMKDIRRAITESRKAKAKEAAMK